MVVHLIRWSCRPRSFANQTGPRRSQRQGGPTYLARDNRVPVIRLALLHSAAVVCLPSVAIGPEAASLCRRVLRDCG
jgi:hypothetical protein